MRNKLISSALIILAAFSLGPSSIKAQAVSIYPSCEIISGYNPEKSDSGYDYVYFGKEEEQAIKWRVLSDNGNAIGNGDSLTDNGNLVNNEKAFFVLAENIMEMTNDVFQSQNYQDSKQKKWCDSVMNGESTIIFSDTEKDFLLSTIKDDPSIEFSSITLREVNKELNGDKLFLLSVPELTNTDYGFLSDVKKDTNRIGYFNEVAEYWVLRQAKNSEDSFFEDGINSGISVAVGKTGTILNSTTKPKGLRPATNIKKEDILFVSNADEPKTNFDKVQKNNSHEWKLTLKDNNSFSDASINAAVFAPGTDIAIKHESLAEISSDYTNITAVISDKEGTPLYYGSVNTDANATETKITIPSDLADGSYTLTVYGEDWNVDKFTDYATGTPFETEIVIDSKAAAASDAINKIPATDKITLSDKAVIEAARKAYDALTDKANVSADDLKKLTDAETKISELQKAADAQKTTATTATQPTTTATKTTTTTAKKAATTTTAKKAATATTAKKTTTATTAKKTTTTPVVKTGKVVTVGNLKYKVTSVKAKSRAVTVTGMKNKKKTTVKIPATIKINKVTYKVTAVANNAFKGNKKIKTVTIGKNVKTIGKNIFKNCKNLKKITVSTKVLKKVGAGALKGINKKAVVKVPANKRKAYKKLFNKKGQAKTVKIK